MRFEHPKHVGFKCERCACCCGDAEHRTRSILLLKNEAYRISEKTGLGLDEFVEKVEGSEPYVYRMRKPQSGKCTFLEGNSCSVYPIRPLICRFYPFQLKALGNDRYVFSFTDECPGIGEEPELGRVFFERLYRMFKESMKENVRRNKLDGR